jgi:prophage DNA circulation protein
MSLFDDLLPGSYKGVTFLMARHNIAGGRKDVLHAFPNTDRQSVEDLGLLPRTFNVTAIINADTSNENYIPRRDSLLAALEEGGTGVLVHPFFGQIENIVARSWTLREDLSELGDGRVDIVFTTSEVIGVPVRAQSSLSVIEQANNSFLAAANADFAANFGVNIANINSFSEATATLERMQAAFATSTNVFHTEAAAIDAFNQQLDDMFNERHSLVQDPIIFANTIQDLFKSVDGLYADESTTTDIMGEFYTFDDNVVPRQENTASRIERNNNDNLMKSMMQGMSLSWSYFNVAQIEFETVTDVESRADALEKQYKKVIAAPGFQDNTKSLLTDLRTEMQQFFNKQKLTARQLITVNTNLTTARLLAFQYYGESTEGERSANLNNTDDFSFLEGNVSILTA